MPERKRLYIGRSGELAVLAEFLQRGYNVATPEIDVGDDVFIIEDGKAGYSPVQVKTGTAKVQESGGFTAQFTFRRDQLVTAPAVELTYVLVVRHKDAWGSFVIIPRSELFAEYVKGRLGNQSGKMLTWEFTFSNDKVWCQGADFTHFRSDWGTTWPSLF